MPVKFEEPIPPKMEEIKEDFNIFHFIKEEIFSRSVNKMNKERKVYNLESFTDEEWRRVEALINQIEEEKKKKWWIVPKYNSFENNESQLHGCYIVDEQKDFYSKSRPPLKSNFNSRVEAEEWLKDYLEKESIFKSAKNDIDNLVRNLGHIMKKLQNHEYITEDDWTRCFDLYNQSKVYGALFKVTLKDNDLISV